MLFCHFCIVIYIDIFPLWDQIFNVKIHLETFCSHTFRCVHQMTQSRRQARVMVTGHILYLLGPKNEQNFMMKWPLEVGIAEFRTRASLLRKSTFLLNRETNSHVLQGLKKKKKIELPQNKQIFSSVSGSLERIKQAFLY